MIKYYKNFTGDLLKKGDTVNVSTLQGKKSAIWTTIKFKKAKKHMLSNRNRGTLTISKVNNLQYVNGEIPVFIVNGFCIPYVKNSSCPLVIHESDRNLFLKQFKIKEY